jgi:hypothetical protein
MAMALSEEEEKELKCHRSGSDQTSCQQWHRNSNYVHVVLASNGEEDNSRPNGIVTKRLNAGNQNDPA